MTFIIALFFAMNIGASGAAASMGIAYGSGAIKGRNIALLFCGIGIFLGSAIGSKEVIKTISTGLIPTSILTTELVLIILMSACVSLFVANILGIPLSTSEVTVGAVIGVGLSYQNIYVNPLTYIVLWWLITPFISFLFAFIANKTWLFFKDKLNPSWTIPKRSLSLFVIITGLIEAFSAGMNNTANAVGPLFGANIINLHSGMIIGGLFVALGTITLGGRVIETNGKKLTTLTVGNGVTVSLTSATIVIVASIFGIPVPMTQITTSGILGIGATTQGTTIFKKKIIKRILTIWILSPLVSLMISYATVKLLIDKQNLSLAISCVALLIIGSIGYIFFSKIKNRRKRRV